MKHSFKQTTGFIVGGLIFVIIALVWIGGDGLQGKDSTQDTVRVVVQKETGRAYAVARKLKLAFGEDLAPHISRIVIEDDMPPFKFVVEVDLTQRINKQQIASVSQTIRSSLGGSYQRLFVGFRVPDGGLAYWATAHQNPDLEVKILGLTRDEHAAATSASFAAKPGERIIAEAQINGIMAGRYQIVERSNRPASERFIVRKYFQGSDEPLETPVTFRDGAYWDKDGRFGERYEITDNRFEIRDQDGLILAAPLR